MKLNVIKILVQPADMYTYWLDNTLEGIYREAARKNMEIEFLNFGCPNGGLTDLANKHYPVLLIGYSTAWMTSALATLHEQGFQPIIVSAQPPANAHTFHAVKFELEEAVTAMMQHLQSAGRRKIALLGTNPDSAADEIKRSVFLAAANAMNLPVGPEDVYPSYASLHECSEHYMERYQRYDAAMCSNDTVAIHLIRQLKLIGCRVPEDLFVSGMGNSNIGRRQKPSLTTIEFDYHELGRQGVRLYTFLLENNTMPLIRASVQCRLIIRESTANYHGNQPDDMKENPDHQAVQYYADPEVAEIIRIEDFMQHSDELDKEILYGLMADETYERLSERLNMSEGTIKYRLKKMQARIGVDNKTELVRLFRNIIP